jgi:heat shock protein HslJ
MEQHQASDAERLITKVAGCNSYSAAYKIIGDRITVNVQVSAPADPGRR